MAQHLRSLYICYYPVTEPLVQTQVVAYLAGLAQSGHCIHLLTFETEPMTPAQVRRWRRQLKAKGITWHHLRYHKRPTLPATIYDVLCGVLRCLRIIRRYHIDTVHARSHVPASMGLMLKRLTGCNLIFDIRGLMAEEYVDIGNWRQDSLPFRLVKNIERRCIDGADGFVVLTERVKQLLFGEDSDKLVRVIPCCADLTHFERQKIERDVMRDQLQLNGKTVMIYIGKFSGWYLQGQMVDFFHKAQDVIPNLHFLVLTQSDKHLIEVEFQRCCVAPTDYTVMEAIPEEIGKYLAAADFSVSFIQACPSKIASSPTKLGEYLAAGLPVVCNPGIGDVDAIVTENNVGILLDSFTLQAYGIAAQRIYSLSTDDFVADRCRKVAIDNFSLEKIGVPRYCSLYDALAPGRDCVQHKVSKGRRN